MSLNKNTIAYGVRIKLKDNFVQKCIGDKFLVEQEDILFISEGHVYNDSKGEYVMIKGGSLTNSGYAYLDELELLHPVPNKPIVNKPHQHVLNCVEHELINAKDGDEIKIIVQENKVEIWNGSVYTGRHIFK